MDWFTDAVLRLVVIGILGLAVVYSVRGIWWTVEQWFSPPTAPHIQLVRQEKTSSAEALWIERSLYETIRDIVDSLTGSTGQVDPRGSVADTSRNETATNPPPEISRVALPPPDLANDSGLPEPLPSDAIEDLPKLQLFEIDILGVLSFLRNRLDRSPALEVTIAYSAEESRIHARYEPGATARSLGPWRASKRTLDEALLDLAYQFVRDYYFDAADPVRGLRAEEFKIFVQGFQGLRELSTSDEAAWPVLRPRLEKAAPVFQQLVSKHPDRVDYRIYLVLTLVGLSQREDAQRELAQALELPPANLELRSQLEHLSQSVKLTAPAAVVPALADQPAVRIHGLEKAAELASRGASVRIGIVASGLSTVIPSFQSRIDAFSVLPGGDSTDDSFGYGTGLANLAAALVPTAHVSVIKVFGDEGAPEEQTIARGIEEAAKRGFDVVYLSFGGSSITEEEKRQIDSLAARGAVVVAPAGNEPGEPVSFPAALPTVLAVGSIDRLGKRSDFSSHTGRIDLYAVGENVVTIDGTGALGTRSGTSYSGLLVAAASGLVKSVAPRLGADEVRRILIETAERPGEMSLLNAFAAVERASRLSESRSDAGSAGPPHS